MEPGLLYGFGIVCIVAAAAGGAVKALGVEVPLIKTVPRQVLVAAIGAVLILVGLGIDAQNDFQIDAVGLRADESLHLGICPEQVSFTGYIEVGGKGGTVRYRFVRHGARPEDNRSAIQTLQFDSTGQQPIEDRWSPMYLRGLPHLTTLSDRVEILQPTQMSSEAAEVRIPQSC